MINEDFQKEYTGKEIYKQLKGKIDIFTAPADMNGLFKGVSRYFLENIADVKIVLACSEHDALKSQLKNNFIEISDKKRI